MDHCPLTNGTDRAADWLPGHLTSVMPLHEFDDCPSVPPRLLRRPCPTCPVYCVSTTSLFYLDCEPRPFSSSILADV